MNYVRLAAVMLFTLITVTLIRESYIAGYIEGSIETNELYSTLLDGITDKEKMQKRRKRDSI